MVRTETGFPWCVWVHVSDLCVEQREYWILYIVQTYYTVHLWLTFDDERQHFLRTSNHSFTIIVFATEQPFFSVSRIFSLTRSDWVLLYLLMLNLLLRSFNTSCDICCFDHVTYSLCSSGIETTWFGWGENSSFIMFCTSHKFHLTLFSLLCLKIHVNSFVWTALKAVRKAVLTLFGRILWDQTEWTQHL